MVKCDLCNQDFYKINENENKLEIKRACECNCENQIREIGERIKEILSTARARKMEIIMVCHTCISQSTHPRLQAKKRARLFLNTFAVAPKKSIR